MRDMGLELNLDAGSVERNFLIDNLSRGVITPFVYIGMELGVLGYVILLREGGWE